MTLIQKLARSLGLEDRRVSAAVDLIDDGNTIPFIARYRKEKTGELDEVALRAIHDQLAKLRALNERRETILNAIREQEKLSPALEQKIMAAESAALLEDLYQPFKKKRQTRAEKGRQRGLQPLADMIVAQERPSRSLAQLARPFLSDEVADVEAAWAGARDIVAEHISEQAEIRGELREKGLKFGQLSSTRIKDSEDPKAVFELYYAFEQRVDRLRPHQVLALNRGEAEKVLRLKVNIAERDWRSAIARRFLPRRSSPLFEQLERALVDAAQRLLLPAIARDVRRALTEAAEAQAIAVFAENLRNLLSQPPLTGRTVLGLDPAYRTGCKIAIIDPTGKLLDTGTIYPHPPQKGWQPALNQLRRWVARYGVTLIAIGNGTASRESEQLIAELIEDQAEGELRYLMVNEAGASVYSASPLAKQELPELDVSLRGAVSIARRVQDPLAELVKIDPQAIGVGMYQHDVDQKRLAAALDGVVESVVNRVGVDLNSASPALLTYVSGIGPQLAQRIVAYREANGRFTRRQQLLEISGLGPKAFEQSAGFLRIREGENWLDSSAIHPESYRLAERIATEAGIIPRMSLRAREAALGRLDVAQLAQRLRAGLPTVRDIVEQLIRPGRDPRSDLPAPILRSDVLSTADLKVGMRLKGTVRNVVDFGAFIDIGVKQDGLLHISKIPRQKRGALGVGDVVEVELLSIDAERGRIGLGWPE